LHVQEAADARRHVVQLFHAKRQLHAPHASERIDEHRNSRTFGPLEQQRRSASITLGAGLALRPLHHLRNFQNGIDFRRDALQFAFLFQRFDKLPQVRVAHFVPPGDSDGSQLNAHTSTARKLAQSNNAQIFVVDSLQTNPKLY
jgi:hypothetical protein